MSAKEATARITINKLPDAAGWRFFQDGNAPANIRLEPGVTIKTINLDALGDNFEKTTKGFVDFLLLDARGFPLLVLEAKADEVIESHLNRTTATEMAAVATTTLRQASADTNVIQITERVIRDVDDLLNATRNRATIARFLPQ